MGVVARHLRRLGILLALVLTGAAPAAAQEAPKGIDVSHWQGQIGWVQVGVGGYDFAFAKATEGVTYDDPTYPDNRAGAGAVGIKLGAYHFARPAGASDAAAVASGVAQADHFVAYAQPQRGDLLPVLDLEATGGLGKARLAVWTEAWLDQVVARLGVRPLIYASPSFWKTSLGDTPIFATAGHRLWIAHWTKDSLPLLPAGGWGGLGWTFWQWTDCSKVPGIGGCVDGDRFNGSSLPSTVLVSTASGLPVSSVPPAIVGTPQAGKLLAATAGEWTGGRPVTFSYQWQRCDAAGAGCTPITGATRATYTPVAADVGHALVVSLSAQTIAGTASAASPPTLAVASSGSAPATAPTATVPPSITGIAQAGQTLSASTGTWTGSPTAFAYQWRRCAGTTCATVAGASGTSYTITPGDIGSTLALVVTATGTGGARSATSATTAPITPAPVPTPSVESALAQPGQAGAVTTADGAATVTWQPGAVPSLATVSLRSSPSRLALKASSVVLGMTGRTPLPWPLDLQYTVSPAEAVAGFLAGRGVWQSIATLPAPALPTQQDIGVYRDTSGLLHVLTRRPGRIALFAPGKWGDPRFASSSRPRLTLASHLVVSRPPDGTLLLRAEFTLDSQARLAVTVETANGRRLTLLAKGSRLGAWLQGGPTNTFKNVQLRPGALPLRVRVRSALTPARLRITAVDPYLRRASLVVPIGPKTGKGRTR